MHPKPRNYVQVLYNRYYSISLRYEYGFWTWTLFCNNTFAYLEIHLIVHSKVLRKERLFEILAWDGKTFSLP